MIMHIHLDAENGETLWCVVYPNLVPVVYFTEEIARESVAENSGSKLYRLDPRYKATINWIEVEDAR